MANTGYAWGSFADLQYDPGGGSVDVDGIDVNDEATLTTDEVTPGTKAGCEISVHWVEGNDGAIDGDLYIYVLRKDTDGNFQTIDDPAFNFALDVVQNATRIKVFSIDLRNIGSFKILVDNDSGQDGDLTLGVRYCDVPVAS